MRVKSKIVGSILALVMGLAVCELMCAAVFTICKARFSFHEPAEYIVSQEQLAQVAPEYSSALGWQPLYKTTFGERPGSANSQQALITTFGDSYTHGDEVQDSETWQTYLEPLVGGAVLNFGVGGYGTDQALLRYRELGTRGEAKTVILGVMLENINRIVNCYRPFYFTKTGIPLTKPRFELIDGTLSLIPNAIQSSDELKRLLSLKVMPELGAKDYWYEHSIYPEFGFPFLRLMFSRTIWLEAIAAVRGRNRSDVDARPTVDLWQDERSRKLMLAIFDEFVADAQRLGQTPIVLLFPRKSDLEMCFNGKSEKGEQVIVDYARRQGLKLFDGIEHLCGLSNQANYQELYAAQGHLSSKGNREIAKGLSEFLKRG